MDSQVTTPPSKHVTRLRTRHAAQSNIEGTLRYIPPPPKLSKHVSGRLTFLRSGTSVGSMAQSSDSVGSMFRPVNSEGFRAKRRPSNDSNDQVPIDLPSQCMWYKLRGSNLSAHAEPRTPALFRAPVRQIVSSDKERLRIVVTIQAGRGMQYGHRTRAGVGKDTILTLEAADSIQFDRWVSALNEAAGTSFDMHYRKEQQLGKGHFANVYRCVDRATGEEFAVKVIHKEKSANAEQNRKFIRREVKVLSITDHENVIKAADFFSRNNKPHIVMEFIRGGTLRDMIRDQGRICEADAQPILAGLLRGVAYLHSLRILHRDLKPDNILMSSPTHPKITDFGLSTFLQPGVEHVKSVVGTPSYVSPEVCSGVPYGRPTDVWSCGIILYYMLAGVRPFIGETREETKQAILASNLMFPEKLFRGVSASAQHLISRLLDPEQQTRPTAADALQHEFFLRS